MLELILFIALVWGVLVPWPLALFLSGLLLTTRLALWKSQKEVRYLRDQMEIREVLDLLNEGKERKNAR